MMRARGRMLGRMLAVFALLLPLAASAAPPRDWTATVTRTPLGSYVIGNPRAKVKLVEYLSLTCSHCAHFAGEFFAPLTAGYIRPGLVSLEIRNAVRDGFDLAGVLLSRCAGPQRIFGATEAILAGQSEWGAKAADFSQASEGRTYPSPDAKLLAMAHGAGLDRLMIARGLPAARVAPCLADTAEQKRVAAMTEEAWSTRKIPGTPAFLLNGALIDDVHDWTALEVRLRAALR